MRIIYAGPHEAVIVPLPDGTTLVARRDCSVDLLDELARRLLEQSVWQRPAAPRKLAKHAGEDDE